MTELETRTYARRDSATSTLRKLGINNRDYNLYINEIDGSDKVLLHYGLALKASGKSGVVESTPKKKSAVGKQSADAEQAAKIKRKERESQRKSRASQKNRAATEKRKAAKTTARAQSKKTQTAIVRKKKQKTKEAKDSLGSITEFCKSRIIDGWTNEEIFEAMQAHFKCSDKKRYYPSWYRCKMRRAGELPKSVDPHFQTDAADVSYE